MRLLFWVCFLTGFKPVALAAGSATSAGVELPVPAGFVSVALAEDDLGRSSGRGRILARFVPEVQKSNSSTVSALQGSRLEVYTSAFADPAGEITVDDFGRLRQLIRSGFFLEQTEKLLGSKYGVETWGAPSGELRVESLYDLPENAVGYVVVESGREAASTVGRRVRVVCEVMRGKDLLRVEYLAGFMKVEQAVSVVKEYSEKLTGSSGKRELSRSLSSDFGVEKRLESSAYADFSRFRFSLLYPVSWGVEYDAGREQLLVLEPLGESEGYSASIVLSTLLLPFEPSEVETEMVWDTVRSTYAGLGSRSDDIKEYSARFGRHEVFIQEFCSGVAESRSGVNSWRRVVTVYEGNMILNISLNIDYEGESGGLRDAISGLEGKQEQMARSVVFGE